MSTDKRVIDLGGAAAGRKVSAFELARYHAGELSFERRGEIEALLANDSALSSELQELRAADAAFRTSMPFERFLSDHEARGASSATSMPLNRGGLFARLCEIRWHLGGGVVAAAAAAFALALFVPGNEPGVGDDTTMGSNRLKGAGAGIGFFVKSDEGARWGSDGERLRAGDRIQLAVKDPAGARSMVIVGVDGRGQVSTYVARRLSSGTPKGDGDASPRLLEQSLVLDDALGAERFFVVYGQSTDVGALQGAAEAAARELARQISAGSAGAASLAAIERLPLPASDVEQSSVHILKVRE